MSDSACGQKASCRLPYPTQVLELTGLSPLLGMQGDEFVSVLAEGKLLRCDRLSSVRLVQCNVTCEGVTCLAKAFEGVGERAILRGAVSPSAPPFHLRGCQ